MPLLSNGRANVVNSSNSSIDNWRNNTRNEMNIFIPYLRGYHTVKHIDTKTRRYDGLKCVQSKSLEYNKEHKDSYIEAIRKRLQINNK